MARITKLNLPKKDTSSFLPGSKPLLRHRAQRPQAVTATPERQLPQQHSYCSQGTQTNQPELESSQDSCIFLSTHKRLNSILARLHDFWWNFTTFIRQYVTAPSFNSYGLPEQRANKL